MVSLLLTLFLLIVPPIVFIIWQLRRFVRRHKERCKKEGRISVAFFHPYCNAGGGGERVLWCAIRHLQIRYPQVDCFVYSGDTDATEEGITRKALDRFALSLPRPVRFIFLHKRGSVEASSYPWFTLIGQSLGSMVLGWEALSNFVPDIYIDSMGYAFTFPLFKFFGGCRTAGYVHYPTVSTDMIQRMGSGNPTAYNNRHSLLSKIPFFHKVKVLYFKLFAVSYGYAGSYCDDVSVNSSWTQGHISYLWKPKGGAKVVYPPCNTSEFETIPISSPKTNDIVSIAQFRPEKDHELQIRSFQKVTLQDSTPDDCRLILIGSCRNSEDEDRVNRLRELCVQLDIQSRVLFKINVPFKELKEMLGQSKMGVHTMWNEHFGIGVVEIMAAGAVVIAHNSGGPQMDIVEVSQKERTGYLADDVESYAEAIEAVLSLPDEDRQSMTARARRSMQRFSEEAFDSSFGDFIKPAVTSFL